MRRTCALLSFCCFAFLISQTSSGQQPEDPQIRSSQWWLDRAASYAEKIVQQEDRSEAHYKLTYAFANRGDFGRALIAASAVNDPQLQVYSFSYVAKQAHQKGDQATCSRALKLARDVAIPAKIGQTNSHMIRTYFELGRGDQALPMAKQLPHPTQRYHAMTNVAQELGKLGRVDEAIQIIRDHQPDTWLEVGYGEIAKACAQAKRFEQAIQLATQIQKPSTRDNAFDRIADLLIRAGQLDRGNEIAKKIEDPKKQSTRVAQYLKESAVSAGTLSLENAMKTAATRTEKVTVGLAQVKKAIEGGDVEKAESTIQLLVEIVQESPEKPQVSKFGSFDDTLLVATIKANYMETARLLREKGDQQSALERAKRAFEAAKAIESQGLGKMMLASRLVQQLTALGDIEGAKELIATMDTPYTQATSSADVAASLILSGKVEEGLRMAEKSVGDRSKAYGTKRVALALFQVERFDELAKYMAQMPDGRHEVRAFREIAGEMVKSGYVQQVDALIDQLPSDAARSQACLGVHDTIQR